MGKKICRKAGRTKGGLKQRNWARTCTGEGAERGKLSVLGKPPTGREVSQDKGSFAGGRSQGVWTEGPPGAARDAPAGLGGR